MPIDIRLLRVDKSDKADPEKVKEQLANIERVKKS